MAALDLEAVRAVMLEVAYEAGAMMLAANPADIDPGTKLNSVDLVTQVDQAVEAMVSARLSKAYPSISVSKYVVEASIVGATAHTDRSSWARRPISLG